MRLLVLFAVPALLLSAETGKPRIAVGGISHETDTFNPRKTGLADFGWKEGGPDDDFLQDHEMASTTISGYLEGAQRFGLQLYPTLLARATPQGTVTDKAFETMTAELVRRLKAAPKLDGVLLALHGAMVVESHPHGDAEIVRRVREALGEDMPIVVTHDFHANVSEEIIEYSDVLITYKECPHLDPKDRGLQAGEIMAGIVSGKVKPVQAISKPAMLLNLIHHDTFKQPLKPIVDESKRLEKDPRILAVSVPGGYQWADVPAMGPSVVVVTDNDPDLAKREARRLSDMLWALRDKLDFKLPNAATAVRLAMGNDTFPVALIDTGDNIGGGASGDSTFILNELLRQSAQGWVVVIADGEAAETAFSAGVGGQFDQFVGGKTDRFHGEPVRIRGRVKSLHDGRYIEPEVRHGGGRYNDMGHTAVIEVEGSTRELSNLLLLTYRRTSPNSLHQLISNGVNPRRQKILVAKGCIAPRAAYEPIAARLIEVDTPGLTAVNPKRFTYKHVRRPLFGLER